MWTIPIIVSAIGGAILDIVLGFNEPVVYFVIGGLGGIISSVLYIRYKFSKFFNEWDRE